MFCERFSELEGKSKKRNNRHEFISRSIDGDHMSEVIHMCLLPRGCSMTRPSGNVTEPITFFMNNRNLTTFTFGEWLDNQVISSYITNYRNVKTSRHTTKYDIN